MPQPHRSDDPHASVSRAESGEGEGDPNERPGRGREGLINVGGGDDAVLRIQLAARWAETFAAERDSLPEMLRRFRTAFEYLDAVTHGLEPQPIQEPAPPREQPHEQPAPASRAEPPAPAPPPYAPPVSNYPYPQPQPPSAPYPQPQGYPQPPQSYPNPAPPSSH